MWVLVVEDEPRMRDVLRQGLEDENHTVTVASDGLEGLQAAEMNPVDAVVLDVMLPGLSGIEVVRRLRSSGRQVPVLLLTARDAPHDVVKGLDAGADDYLTKPFAFGVLLARLRALTRRGERPAAQTLAVGDLSLDPATRVVRRAGRIIDLTNTEFRVLDFLMRRAGRACSRAAIVDGVWGLEKEIQTNTVDAFIRLLRSKIDGDGQAALIHSVRGFGYILREGE